MPRKLPADSSILRNEPLWQRAPTRDAQGRPFSDFMLIIPGLRSRSRDDIHEVVGRIESVLAAYTPTVAFADLNLELNLLWVSVRPVPGVTRQIVLSIQDQVPDALLVASRLPADPFAAPVRRRHKLLPRWVRRLRD